MGARDIRAPALSKLDVDVFVVLPDPRIECNTWATAPSILVVAGTLLPEKAMNFPIRVLNPTPSDIRLNKGQQCVTEDVIVSEPNDTSTSSQCTTVQQSTGATLTTKETAVLAPFWQNLAPDIPDDGQHKLCNLILEHRQAFSLHEMDFGHTEQLQHGIDKGTEMSVRQPLRRQPLALLPVIDDQVNQMLDQGLIEPANSAWSSNVVIVKKKDGTLHFCIDYRSLNSKTRKDAYPRGLGGVVGLKLPLALAAAVRVPYTTSPLQRPCTSR